MYALTVRFVLPEGTDWSKVPDVMAERAEKLYKNMPGLVSKAFLYDPESREYGGNYVWKTKQDLDAFLISEVFKAGKEKFGEPVELHIHKIAAYLDRGYVHVSTFPPSRKLGQRREEIVTST